MGKDKKPRGRMNPYACFVQTSREEHKSKHPNVAVGFADFSKKCSEKWKAMSDNEKKRFEDLANSDKKRYEEEMSTYVPSKEDKKRKRAKKDPNAPKRPLSGYFWFCNDERPKVREELGSSSVSDVAKVLGMRWNASTDEMKQKYVQLAARDKARYEQELEAYKRQQGGQPDDEENEENGSDEEDDD